MAPRSDQVQHHHHIAKKNNENIVTKSHSRESNERMDQKDGETAKGPNNNNDNNLFSIWLNGRKNDKKESSTEKKESSTEKKESSTEKKTLDDSNPSNDNIIMNKYDNVRNQDKNTNNNNIKSDDNQSGCETDQIPNHKSLLGHNTDTTNDNNYNENNCIEDNYGATKRKETKSNNNNPSTKEAWSFFGWHGIVALPHENNDDNHNNDDSSSSFSETYERQDKVTSSSSSSALLWNDDDETCEIENTKACTDSCTQHHPVSVADKSGISNITTDDDHHHNKNKPLPSVVALGTTMTDNNNDDNNDNCHYNDNTTCTTFNPLVKDSGDRCLELAGNLAKEYSLKLDNTLALGDALSQDVTAKKSQVREMTVRNVKLKQQLQETQYKNSKKGIYKKGGTIYDLFFIRIVVLLSIIVVVRWGEQKELLLVVIGSWFIMEMLLWS